MDAESGVARSVSLTAVKKEKANEFWQLKGKTGFVRRDPTEEDGLKVILLADLSDTDRMNLSVTAFMHDGTPSPSMYYYLYSTTDIYI